MTRRLIVEADGGSRGNPGPAGYGALVRDAETGRVLAERAASVGRATNNVAEYGGLVAGLQAALDLDPTAEVEVRMDSKLVVEQMSGRWQIKHPDMRQLALQAQKIARQLGQVRYTWVPRAQNGAADALADIVDGTARHEQARTDVAGGIPEALLSLYDRIRTQTGSTGAAMLQARACQGCRLELYGNELSAVRNADPHEVVRCENCGRILVRTAESGL